MRKVLLATTALVALGGASAANAADLSISGSVGFEVTTGDTTTYNDDANFVITAKEVMDNGVTWTAVMNVTGNDSTATAATTTAAELAGATGSNTEDTYIDFAGDFGSVRLGDTDAALDRMDGVLPSMWNEGVGYGDEDSVAAGGDLTGVSYFSPNMSGATIYAEADSEGANTGFGINYSNSGVTVMYQNADRGGVDATAIGVNFSLAGFKVGFGQVDEQAAAGGAKTKNRSMGLEYSINDQLGVGMVQAKTVGANVSYNAFYASYSVGNGVALALETDSRGDQNNTYFHVAVSF